MMPIMNCTQEVTYHNLEYVHLYFTNVSSANVNGKAVSACEDARMSFMRNVIILELIIMILLLVSLAILSYRKACLQS